MRFPKQGFSQRGSKNPSAKVSESQVRRIRAAYKAGTTVLDLLRVYSTMSRSGIYAILQRRSWSHVADTAQV